MKYMVHDGEKYIGITAENGELSIAEIDLIMKKAAEHQGCSHIDVKIDGDYLDCNFRITPFERIRRITGYLVGTTDRWNNAKREELNDRVKHGFDITDDDFFD